MLQIHLYENGKPLRESSFPEFPEALITTLKDLFNNHNSGIGKVLIENDEFGWSCSITNAQSVQNLDTEQPSQWDEEDEEELDYIIEYITKNKDKDTIYTKKTQVLENMIDWLRELKFRVTLKPSLKQSSFNIDEELNAWRHEHFHGDRDFSASGEYMKRETQRSLAEYFLTLGMTLAQSK